MNFYKIVHVDDYNRLLGNSSNTTEPDLENIRLLEELRRFREQAKPTKATDPVVKSDPVITTGSVIETAPVVQKLTEENTVPKKSLPKVSKGDKRKEDITRFIIEHGGVITTPTVELGNIEMQKKQFEADLNNIADNKLRKMKSPLLNFLIDNGYSKRKLPRPMNTAWAHY